MNNTQTFECPECGMDLGFENEQCDCEDWQKEIIKEKVQWDENLGDNNNGFIYGIYYYENEDKFNLGEVFECEWFETIEHRDQAFID